MSMVIRLKVPIEMHYTVIPMGTSEVYCTVLANTVIIRGKFQNLQDLNSRTSQGFSSTFKHLICFQALSRALKFYSKFRHFQGFLKHAMNPLCCSCGAVREDQGSNPAVGGCWLCLSRQSRRYTDQLGFKS